MLCASADTVSRVGFLSTVTVVLSLLTLAPQSLEARTWHIAADGSGDAPTIQAGVDSASVGDIVLVGPGTYSDTLHVDLGGEAMVVNVRITKEIVVRAESGGPSARIDATNSDIGVLLIGVGGAARVEGFEISFTPELAGGCVHLLSDRASVESRASVAPIGTVAIWCESSPCILNENMIRDAVAGTGIHLNNSAATVTKNLFTNVGFAVNAENSSNADIAENTFTNCASAVASINSSPVIANNLIQRTGPIACRGIECVSSGPVDVWTPIITGNRIESMENEAIWCFGVTATITRNLVRNCTGVDVNFGGMTVFSENVLVDNVHGVYFQGTPTGTIERNTFVGNQSAIGAYQGSNPLISSNIIYGGAVGIECAFFAFPSISCNDVYATSDVAYGGDCGDQTGLNGNFSSDPQFCGTQGSGNYYLQSDSPCMPGNHPNGAMCGTVGALGTACSTVPVSATTWGDVKRIYKGR